MQRRIPHCLAGLILLAIAPTAGADDWPQWLGPKRDGVWRETGDLVCCDAVKGGMIWSKKLLKEYDFNLPMWGFAGHPLLDGDRLICLVGGKGAVAVAFNKDTGAEIWKNLSASEPGYAPPMIYENDGKRLLIVCDPDSINALDPVTGKL